MLSSCKLLRNESYVSVEDSFIHVFFLVGYLFPVHVQGSDNCRSDSKRFQFRQAVVQQSRRENIVAYLLLWSAIQRLAGARSRLYHVRLLLSKQHVSAFFKMYRLRVLPQGSLSCSLLVFHSAFLAFLLACLFCFFPFVSISAPFVFCSVFLVVHYVSWRFLALRGLSWLALAFPGFSWLCLAFLFSCLCFFAGFLVCSVSWPFDIDTRLCKALCPHPGEVVYLTYLFLVSLV